MLNKVTLIGNIGADPEFRTFDNGDRVANLSLATSERWKDKNSGENKEKTEWHRVVVFGKLVEIIESYVKKGSKLYLEGQIETRSWEDQSGDKKYSTEIVLRGFGGKMVMLDSKGDAPASGPASTPTPAAADELEEEIPF